MTKPVRIVGLGGSLRAESTSRAALEAALAGAAASGADTELVWVRDLGLPLYTAEHAPRPPRSGSRTPCTSATRWSGAARPTTDRSAARSRTRWTG